ncbi:hypothetical protein [Saccharopolyspora oryzae]|uniref:Uncharacterized protein n=1 Tax=Saccharopolyspora oryzae TaxID=2997343 RepID=A0ABT4UZK4_9PSEU|nr:hypothetical protein [Saccharopolyspora oryzae]MDA3627003.1 hypothetical protein [Saccharopolyspora oryzae]
MSVPPAVPEPRVIAGDGPAVEGELFSESPDRAFGELAEKLAADICRSLGVPGSETIL